MTTLARLKSTVAAYRKAHAALRALQADGPELFRAAREKLGLRQRDMAELLGIDVTYLSKIETGTMPPGTPTLEALYDVLTGVGR